MIRNAAGAIPRQTHTAVTSLKLIAEIRYRMLCEPGTRSFVCHAFAPPYFNEPLKFSIGIRPANDTSVTGEDLRAALDVVPGGDAACADQVASIGCIKWTPGNESDYF